MMQKFLAILFLSFAVLSASSSSFEQSATSVSVYAARSSLRSSMKKGGAGGTDDEAVDTPETGFAPLEGNEQMADMDGGAESSKRTNRLPKGNKSGAMFWVKIFVGILLLAAGAVGSMAFAALFTDTVPIASDYISPIEF